MTRLVYLLLLAFVLAGCASSSEGLANEGASSLAFADGEAESFDIETPDYRLRLPVGWESETVWDESDPIHVHGWFLDPANRNTPESVVAIAVRSQERQSDPDEVVKFGIERAVQRGDLIEGYRLVDGDAEQFETFVSKNLGDPDTHVLVALAYNEDLIVRVEFYAPAVEFDTLRAEIEPHLFALDVLNPPSS